ncbi:MAG: helicase-associated domain-containing protein [Lapillicoccus sp.]
MPRPSSTTSAAEPSTARSLADDIRARSDAELSELIIGRPDLARPAPADLTSLAARASTRASVQRCLEALDRGELQVLEAAVVADDGTEAEEVARILGTRAEVRPFLDRLWQLALLWRGADGLHVVRTVPDVLGPTPVGLGPKATELVGTPSARLTDPEEIAALVAETPVAGRAILERLTWGPPVGVLNADGSGALAARWLLDHGLLARVVPERSRIGGVEAGDTRVVLPRDVAMVLRGGRIHPETRLEAPAAVTADVAPGVIDATAGGEATDLLTLLEEVAIRWGPEPPRVLRTGGLAVRDLRVIAVALDLSPERAAWLVEIAYAAGLLADDGELVPVWAPTGSFDEWLGRDAGTRWARLATTWLASTRAAHLVGAKSGGASSAANALGPDVHWPPIRAIRAEVLAELATLPPGVVATPASVIERLRWRRPLRNPRVLQTAAAAVLQEAEWLGVTGRGALSSAGRALASGADVMQAAAAMAATLPAAVDHVLLQADLTAIAPGPLEGALARLMRLSADIESRGGATVYRFSPSSVRQALDTGMTADELLDALRLASRTGLPQPLDYLVRDVARRHGQTRVGGATAYIRSDDETVLEAMVADRTLATLQLRRIAPTVLVSPADPLLLLDLLRDSGHAPVQEGQDGGVVVAARTPRRATGRRDIARPLLSPVDIDLTTRLVQELRLAEEAAEHERATADPNRPRLMATDPTVTISALRDAAADRHGVWIGYADGTGRTATHLFYPTRVEGGRAFGTIADSSEERTFSIHRVTGVASA